MIFGILKSYIIYNGETVTLENSIVTPDWFQNNDIVHKSIITGKRTHSWRADYASFNLIDYLFKYTDPTLQFQSIKNLQGMIVDFYLHGQTYIAECFIAKVKPIYLFDRIKHDACNIHLYPTKYTLISQDMLSEDGTPMLMENGTPMKTEGITLI